MATNLGTAYVSVMPSMKGFGAAVESGMSGIDTSGAGAKMGSKAASGFAGGMAKGGVVMGAASALTSKAFDAVASSASRAIGRVDTMQNFPKVMKNLGYDAEDAAKSIQTMSDRLDGLPTALDTMVSMTQQLAPLSGGLDEATEIALAFNDMMLAGGASTAEQASALTQYTQALAKGKPEMNDWRTLQQTMPGQLNQVAEAMLGAGKNSTDLYEALKGGKVSMSDFNKAVLKLDKEGVNGFASFEQQARDSTTGIQTAIDNMNTRVAKGVATLIDAVGQENISSAINTLSSGIGGVASDLAEGVKAATGFVKEHGEQIGWLVGKVYEIAPAAITAWGAFKVFKGGKAVFSDIISGSKNLIGSLLEVESAAGKAGAAAVGVSGGAAGLVAGVGVGIAALYTYNQYLNDMARAEAGLNEEQQATIGKLAELNGSWSQAESDADSRVKAVEKETEKVYALKDEYNSLVAKGEEMTKADKKRAKTIRKEIAEALGVEKGKIDELIDDYGKLGDAADDAIERQKAQKILEANEDKYNEAVSKRNELVLDLAESRKVEAEAAEKVKTAEAAVNGAMQDNLDAFAAMPEGISYANMALGQMASGLDGARDALSDVRDEIGEGEETLRGYDETARNFEGLSAAVKNGSADEIKEYVNRVTNHIQSSEDSTRESLEAQVEKFQSAYDTIAQAVADGDASLEGDLADMDRALELSVGELDKFNAVDLKSKTASASVKDGSLVIASGRVYKWNGTKLKPMGTVADVKDKGLLDGQKAVYTWNGSKLNPKSTSVAVDTSAIDKAKSAWANWKPGSKNLVTTTTNTTKNVINTVKKTGDASGGFYALHASGGFVTNGPVELGRDRSGVMHVAGEAGREWIQKHADGTTSIVPIENKKYLAPYANVIAGMLGLDGRGANGGVTVNLNYTNDASAERMALDAARSIRRLQMAGAF